MLRVKVSKSNIYVYKIYTQIIYKNIFVQICIYVKKQNYK